MHPAIPKLIARFQGCLHIVQCYGYGGGVERDEVQLSADIWRELVRSRGSIEQDRVALARLIEYDGDSFETQIYEHFSDPLIRLVDRAERSYAGQYDRRLRRLRERARHTEVDR
jgi:hypothetical protein